MRIFDFRGKLACVFFAAALCAAAVSCRAPLTLDIRRADLKLSFIVSGASSPAGAAPGARLLLPSAASLTVTLTPTSGTSGSPVSQTTAISAGTPTASISFSSLPFGSYTAAADAFDASGTKLFTQSAEVSISAEGGALTLNLVPVNPDAVPTLNEQVLSAVSIAAGTSKTWRVPAGNPLLCSSLLLLTGTVTDVSAFVQTMDGVLKTSSVSSSGLSMHGVSSGQDAYLTLYNGGAAASSVGMIVGPVMKSIPSGTEGGVSVAAFSLAAYEVTQAQFQAVMGFNPSWTSNLGDAVPVQNVTWYDALSFCNKLSALAGLDQVYAMTGLTYDTGAYGSTITSATVTADFSKNGYRLPLDAERVLAARAGTTTTYHWGDAADDPTVDAYARYTYNSGGYCSPVGQKTPNGYGLYDMSGNVWEWGWGADSSTTITPKRYGGSRGNPASELGSASYNSMTGAQGGNLGYWDNGFRVARGDSFTYHTVSFDTNGASAGTAPVPVSYLAGESVSFPTCVGRFWRINPNGDGVSYGFKGWNTDPAATTAFESCIVTGNTTLYAVWAPLAVGDVGPAGGYIFYDKGSFDNSPSGAGASWRYMEAAPAAAELSARGNDFNGGNNGSPINGTYAGIGFGLENTTLYATGTFQVFPNGEYRSFSAASPAGACYALTHNGFDDWFLPSQDEQVRMYTALKTSGLGGFSDAAYWNSYWGTSWDLTGFVWMADGTAGFMYNTNGALSRPARRF